MNTQLNSIKVLGALIMSLPAISVMYVTVAFHRDSLILLYVMLGMTVVSTVFSTLFCVYWINSHHEARMRTRRNHPTYVNRSPLR